MIGRKVRATRVFFALFTFMLINAGCDRTKVTPEFEPIVSAVEVEQKPVTSPEAAQRLLRLKARMNSSESLALVKEAPTAIEAKVTLKKKSILGRTFLYGSDLQYSSLDEGDGILLQALAIGHIAVHFKKVGSSLLLLEDTRSYYESDINHPERLIHSFSIVSESETTFTIVIDRASPVINTVLDGEAAQPVRTSWLRSIQYVEKGDYLMFETSIESADGIVAEFMEAVFPRDTLVRKNDKPIYDDEDLEPHAARYEFLSNYPLFFDIDGDRVQTSVANRFAMPEAGKTIDWYITANAPKKYVQAVKTGIEAWNRYSQAMWGRDLVRFKGRLPKNVKIGDPRYNVVNWDNVADAGSAYESQASDPYTGIQSHSLVYLPMSWIEFGRDYWEKGQASEQKAEKLRKTNAVIEREIARKSFLGRKLAARCFRDLLEQASLAARLSPDEFGIELLKGVVFHEIGHALGLGHNFKGSLSYDHHDADSVFSTSIMDYNQYQLEVQAFASLDSSNGPLLEYDRQIISVLYNEAKDVKESDPELPACNDADADNEEGGVDPLCIRYDAGKDPTEALEATRRLLSDENATFGRARSLVSAIKTLKSEMGDSSKVTDKESAEKAVGQLVSSITGVVSFYYTYGAQSLSSMTRSNLGSLRSFQDEVLPGDYHELEMRMRVIQVVREIAGMENFDPSVRAALAAYKEEALAWLRSSPYARESGNDGESELEKLLKRISSLPDGLEASTLTRLRRSVLGALSASMTAPFYYLDDGSTSVDFEHEVAQMLYRKATETLASGKARPVDERVAAARALKSFEQSAVGAKFVQDAALALQTESQRVRTMDERQSVLSVYRVLTANP